MVLMLLRGGKWAGNRPEEGGDDEKRLNPATFPRIGNLRTLHPPKEGNGIVNGRRYLGSVFGDVEDGVSSSSSSSSYSSSSSSSSDTSPPSSPSSFTSSSSATKVSRATRIDYFYGRKSMGFIKRMMFLIDLERALRDSNTGRETRTRHQIRSPPSPSKQVDLPRSRSTCSAGEDEYGNHEEDEDGYGHEADQSNAEDAEMEMRWETDWELRWEVLAAVLHHNQTALASANAVGSTISARGAGKRRARGGSKVTCGVWSGNDNDNSAENAASGHDAMQTDSGLVSVDRGGINLDEDTEMETDMEVDIGCVEYHSWRFTQNEWYEED